MLLSDRIRLDVGQALQELYSPAGGAVDFQISLTKPEFEGDYTVVLFSLVKSLRKSPEDIASSLGSLLMQKHPELYASYQLIKGFMNLTIAEPYLTGMLEKHYRDTCFGRAALRHEKVMVEYSSPTPTPCLQKTIAMYASNPSRIHTLG